jgi:hypothetical protein
MSTSAAVVRLQPDVRDRRDRYPPLAAWLIGHSQTLLLTAGATSAALVARSSFIDPRKEKAARGRLSKLLQSAADSISDISYVGPEALMES